MIGAPQGNTILRPLDEILGIEVGIKSFSQDIEIDIVILEHIKQ
jgi:hypothetical protein